VEKAQKLKPRKFLLKQYLASNSAKFCTSENFPLYGIFHLFTKGEEGEENERERERERAYLGTS
jgi:hypothetical protein